MIRFGESVTDGSKGTCGDGTFVLTTPFVSGKLVADEVIVGFGDSERSSLIVGPLVDELK